jgi:hypothetical protein
MTYLHFLKSVKPRKQFFDGGRRRQHLASPKKTFLPALEALEDRTLLTTYRVISLGDDNVGIGDFGDLRYVINRANDLHTGTPINPDLIQFDAINLTPDNHTIHVGAGAAGKTPLPALTARVTIDGTTARGYDYRAGLMLTLEGHSVHGDGNGLVLQGGHATVTALEIINFPGHGILVTSDCNTVGGDVVGVDANGCPNNPAGRITSPPGTSGMTTPVVVRPPLGNVISANGGDGVQLVNANSNVLEGNFIGTDIAGTAARGNGGDGVALINSDYNQLLGTTPPDQNNPFVFYNVISGNKGNGLVVDDSDHTLIYANFFGLGADNNTPVGNQGDGVLIEGTSDETRFGLNIPLGSVSSANGQNGVEVRDSASRTLLMNTFAGVAAFNPAAQVPNHRDGTLITSDGGGTVYAGARFTTLIHTCQFSGNDRDGIEIGGNAVGVQVSSSVVGLDTKGTAPQPNRQNGIEIGGNASGVAVGGFEPSVLGNSEFPDGTFPLLEAANLISGNLWNGVDVGGNAAHVKIVNSFIGTDITHEQAAANGRNGILLDGVSGVQVGSAVGANTPRDRNIIAFNGGDGVLVRKGTGDSILGNSIFDNGGLGIDLQAGGNHNQPAPVLTSAQIGGLGLLQVTGTLTARPNTPYQIEIFASRSGRPGNGGINLGFITVTTDWAGFAQFTILNVALPDPLADFISATATSPEGDTSVFSALIRANHSG